MKKDVKLLFMLIGLLLLFTPELEAASHYSYDHAEDMQVSGRINKEGRMWRFIEGKEIIIQIGEKEFSIHTSALISGLLFIILGYLIFSGVLFSFNHYVASSSFQQLIFAIEEKLLGIIS